MKMSGNLVLKGRVGDTTAKQDPSATHIKVLHNEYTSCIQNLTKYREIINKIYFKVSKEKALILQRNW